MSKKMIYQRKYDEAVSCEGDEWSVQWIEKTEEYIVKVLAISEGWAMVKDQHYWPIPFVVRESDLKLIDE